LTAFLTLSLYYSSSDPAGGYSAYTQTDTEMMRKMMEDLNDLFGKNDDGAEEN